MDAADPAVEDVQGRQQRVLDIAISEQATDLPTTGRQVVSSLSRRDDGALALLMATSARAAEAFAFQNGMLRRLTHQNDALFDELQLGATEDFASKSKDGSDVHSIVVKPAAFVTPSRDLPESMNFRICPAEPMK